MKPTLTRMLAITVILGLTAGMLVACGEAENTSAGSKASDVAPVIETPQQERERADRQHEAFRSDEAKPRETRSATVPAR